MNVQCLRTKRRILINNNDNNNNNKQIQLCKVCLCTKGFTVKKKIAIYMHSKYCCNKSVNLLASRSEFQLRIHPASHSYKPNCQSSDVERVYSQRVCVFFISNWNYRRHIKFYPCPFTQGSRLEELTSTYTEHIY